MPLALPTGFHSLFHGFVRLAGTPYNDLYRQNLLICRCFYYGAADTVTALAFAFVDELIAFVKENSLIQWRELIPPASPAAAVLAFPQASQLPDRGFIGTEFPGFAFRIICE